MKKAITFLFTLIFLISLMYFYRSEVLASFYELWRKNCPKGAQIEAYMIDDNYTMKVVCKNMTSTKTYWTKNCTNSWRIDYDFNIFKTNPNVKCHYYYPR